MVIWKLLLDYKRHSRVYWIYTFTCFLYFLGKVKNKPFFNTHNSMWAPTYTSRERGVSEKHIKTSTGGNKKLCMNIFFRAISRPVQWKKYRISFYHTYVSICCVWELPAMWITYKFNKTIYDRAQFPCEAVFSIEGRGDGGGGCCWWRKREHLSRVYECMYFCVTKKEEECKMS